MLRQMRGRRLDDHGAATFHSTSNPEHPVVVDTSWQHPSSGETEKQSLVRHLQVRRHVELRLSFLASRNINSTNQTVIADERRF